MDWQQAFEIVSEQRDKATQNFNNLQIQLVFEQRAKKALEDRVVKLEADLISLRGYTWIRD